MEPSVESTAVNRLAAIAARNSHHYTALPQEESIRLIRLLPGRQDEQIECSLDVITHISQSPPHEALSYCWGDCDETKLIQCNGKEFSVTKNLYSALLRLRRETEERFFWVDAACINQHDLQERMQQVARMRSIYAHADGVIVWLGPSDIDSATALEMIVNIARACCSQYFGAQRESEWISLLRKVENLSDIGRAGTVSGLDSPHDKRWHSFSRFYERPWFSRVWVIQEVQASRHTRMLCGDMEIEWEYVALAARWIYGSEIRTRIPRTLYSQHGLVRADFIRNKAFQATFDAPFLQLLWRGALFSASDSRDKVFTLLQHQIRKGKAKRESDQLTAPKDEQIPHLALKPDYSISKLQLSWQIAVRSIEKYGTLEVFGFVQPPNTWNSAWPSWVPRWDVYRTRAVMRHTLHDACGGSRPSLWKQPSLNEICLEGISLDSVAQRHDFLTLGCLPSSSLLAGGVSLRKSLTEFSLLAVMDKFEEALDVEGLGTTRAKDNLDQHFADFSAFVLKATEDSWRSGPYIILDGTYCDKCGRSPGPNKTSSSNIPHVYNCSVCDNGGYDLCIDCYEQGNRCQDPPHHTMRQRVPTGVVLPAENQPILSLLKVTATGGKPERFSFNAQGACYMRSFFTTSRGLIGLGQDVSEGDEIVVLYGGRVPFLLRKQQRQEQDVHRLVGDSFIAGIMDGEW